MGLDGVYHALEAGVGTRKDGTQRSVVEVKRRLRVWCRAGGFLSVTLVFFFYNSVARLWDSSSSEWDASTSRRLEGSCVEPANPSALCLPYALGCLYLLLALAIVADEFFVPALTLIGEYFELSEDVTGATLMAMGGSAPELFTNAAGTFARSDVGFGAIVGSAVFNLLFVIGICAAVSSRPLQLTWYPLTRDSVCYMIVLISLAIFFGVTSPGVMELWESLILHFEYWGYVFLMRYSARIQEYLDRPSADPLAKADDNAAAERHPSVIQPDVSLPMISPRSFRTGVMGLLTHNKTPAQAAEMALVSRLVGAVGDVFDDVDKDKSRQIDLAEMTACLSKLGLASSPAEARSVFDAIDTDGNGTIDRAEFETWFKRSRQMVELEVNCIFAAMDKDKSGTLDQTEVSVLLETLGGPARSAEEVSACFNEMSSAAPTVTLEQFSDWYFSSANPAGYSSKVPTPIPAEGEASSDDDEPRGWKYWVMLPITFSFGYTIPNVENAAFKSIRFAFLAFAVCLAWMGLICYFLVDWVEIIGATAGIPSVIMGLTFLAAGTSVPDMLGAIIVAKRGQGDMAVSSSVGSNVFDITVGLALPWLLFYAVYQESYTVGADSLFVSIVIIVVSVAVVLGTLRYNKWLHTKTTGYIFMSGYLVFVAQQLARVDWKNAGGC